MSPDGNQLWTAASEDGTISIIALPTKKLTTKIDARITGANRLKFAPDGRLVFISSLRTSALAIYDAQSRRKVKHIKVGRGAAGILMSLNGTRVLWVLQRIIMLPLLMSKR